MASSAEVTDEIARLTEVGLVAAVEECTTCCYATQDKVWAREPEGLRWEWYRASQDSETFAK